MPGRQLNYCFHGVGSPTRQLEPGEDHYWITKDTFHRFLDELAEDHVSISFDDGNVSDIEIGLPALLDRGMTATFFVLAGRLGRPGSLSPEHVRQLAAAGMSIGTHGMDHVPWRGLDAGTAHREFIEARSTLGEVLGRPIDEAAFPLGRYDRRLLRQLRKLGYRRVHTSDHRWARQADWVQARFSAHSIDTVESLRRDVLARPLTRTLFRGDAKGLAKKVL